MNRIFVLAALTVLWTASAVSANTITVQALYQGAFLEGQPGVDQGTPVLLGGATDLLPNNVRLKFFVPDYQNLYVPGIARIDVSVEVYDDDDANNREEGWLVFVMNNFSYNYYLTPFGADWPIDWSDPNSAYYNGLNGYTSANPATVTGYLDCECGLVDAIPEIMDDGIFFIRVNRDGGDFYVKSATASILITPEPASGSLAALGMAAAAFLRWRTRKNQRQTGVTMND